MDALFDAIRVRRRTAETDFAVVLAPRASAGAAMALPNRLLSHFIDHFAKAAGIDVTLASADWPGSWEFDHVLCEDLGQLIGRGVAAIADQRRRAVGISGRASATGGMDECASAVSVSLEARPRCDWQVPRRVDIDGFIDAWYGAGGAGGGAAYGANLRQFFDGFAYGSGASVRIEISRGGNLHHLYESVFRNLGDAVGGALGTVQRLPGESSGLAGTPEYTVEPA